MTPRRHEHSVPGEAPVLTLDVALGTSLVDAHTCGGAGTLHGSKGVFSYLVPANSLTVVRVAR